MTYISKLDRISPENHELYQEWTERYRHPKILERQNDGLQTLIADPSPNKLMPPELQLGLIKGQTPEDLRRLFCPDYVPRAVLRTVLSASSSMVARAPSSGVRASLCRCATPRTAKACSSRSTACYPPGASVAFLVV
jgi:hypothetical protein